MFYACIALIGIYAFTKIGIDLLPNVNIPHLQIQTQYQNASPEEVEKQITEPLESAVATNPNANGDIDLFGLRISLFTPSVYAKEPCPDNDCGVLGCHIYGCSACGIILCNPGSGGYYCFYP